MRPTGMVREIFQGPNQGPSGFDAIISGRNAPSGEKYGWMYDPKSKSFYYHNDNQLNSRKTLSNDDLKALGRFINDISS